MTSRYIRVSGEAQLDGYGLDIQRDSTDALARLESLTIDRTFSDEGISGAKDTTERPGLDALIVFCQDNPGETVLLPKLDRLARSLAIQETVLAVLWEAGATVLSADPAELHYLRTGDDPDDPTRTLIRQVLGAVAQFERGQIRLRLRGGRRKKIAAHGWAGGVEPYGWTDPHEQRVLAAAVDLRAHGRTWQQVCDQLNLGGLVKRGGSEWNPSDLCRTVRRARQRPAQPVLAAS